MVTVVRVFLRLGEQHDGLERTLDLEPSRRTFDLWLPHLLGGDLGAVQGFYPKMEE